jgi:hypothetical protein
MSRLDRTVRRRSRIGRTARGGFSACGFGDSREHVEDEDGIPERVALRATVDAVEDVELIVDQLHRSAVADLEGRQVEGPSRDEPLARPVDTVKFLGVRRNEKVGTVGGEVHAGDPARSGTLKVGPAVFVT